MTSDIHSPQYAKALELAEAGRHNEALEHLEAYLSTAPDDPEALNDAGAILHCLGRSDQALARLNRARTLRPDSGEILWNLCEAYLAAGWAGEVLPLLDDVERLGMLNSDLLNRTATGLLNQLDKANAMDMLLWSSQLSPGQKVLAPMLEIIRSKRPKVAIFCGADGMTFMNDLAEYIKQRFETRIFEGRTDTDLYDLMSWADISWFEWCTNLAAAASNMPKVCKTIVRLHRYEAYEQWPQQVNWNNVDVLITLGNEITRQSLLSKVPDIETRTSVVAVPNGIDLEKFKFRDRPRGKNIAFLANLRLVKNPAFVMQCMQKLHYIDPQYRLFFAGSFQDKVLEQYLRHIVKALDIEDVVSFDGWQNDVNAWLADKHFIVSTSICEGHPVGILEAMAAGLKPVIHNFLGADLVFPREYLFNISEQFCEQITSGSYNPVEYRRFVEQNYSLKRQLRKIGEIFRRLENQIDAQSLTPPLGIRSIGRFSPQVLQNIGVV